MVPAIISELGFSELVIIGIIAVLLYGKDLPLAARKLSKLYTQLRRQINDIKDEISRQIPPDDFPAPPVDVSGGTDPPSAPANLVAIADGARVTLTWDPSDRARGYTVKRASSKDERFVTLSAGLESPSYVDTEVGNGQTYIYVVTAYNSAGDSGDSVESVATVPQIAPFGESKFSGVPPKPGHAEPAPAGDPPPEPPAS